MPTRLSTTLYFSINLIMSFWWNLDFGTNGNIVGSPNFTIKLIENKPRRHYSHNIFCINEPDWCPVESLLRPRSQARFVFDFIWVAWMVSAVWTVSFWTTESTGAKTTAGVGEEALKSMLFNCLFWLNNQTQHNTLAKGLAQNRTVMIVIQLCIRW